MDLPYVAYETNTRQGNDMETGMYKHAHITMPSRDGITKIKWWLFDAGAYDLKILYLKLS